MQNLAPDKNDHVTIHDLYPHLDEAQLKEAEENLQRYVEIAMRIYERIQLDERPCEQPALTASTEDHTIDRERSNPTNHHLPTST
jgi:hypothetical protein